VRRIVIIGGGITGLAAAWYAERQNLPCDVVLVERDSRVGGKIRTERAAIDSPPVPGAGGGNDRSFVLEAGAESMLSRKTAAIVLCRELGIEERLIGATLRRHGSFVFHSGRLYPLPSGFTGLVPGNPQAVLESDLLSPAGKARFCDEPNIPPHDTNSDESIAAFMKRRYGEEAFELLIDPLAGGIFAGNTALLSMDATFPNLRERERIHGSLGAGPAAPSQPGAPPAAGVLPPFVTFPDGMSTLVEQIRAGLRRSEVRMRLGALSIERMKDSAGLRYRVETDGQTGIDADAVLLATPAFESETLLSRLSPTATRILAGIPYASTAIVHIAFRSPAADETLDGHGYVVPSIDHGLFTAATWTSSKWPGRAPAGYALVRFYAGRFGSVGPLELTDDELVARACEELERATGVVATPELSRVYRWDRAIPQYNLGHLDRVSLLRACERQIPGIYFAGAAFDGVGIPDCIGSAREAVGKISHNLGG